MLEHTVSRAHSFSQGAGAAIALSLGSSDAISSSLRAISRIRSVFSGLMAFSNSSKTSDSS